MTADGPPASGSVPYMQAQPSLIGETLDGRYKIIRKLGEGGMGEVYAAEHVHIEKRFAIKLLRPEIVSNAEAVQRFRQEARSSSSIGHRNIIAIEDFGQMADGRIYMCMELLNGAALNDLIQTPLGTDRLLNILIQTGHGLAAAHAKGIVHRDMKPENIFVTIGSQGEDVPKILDFGIAKVAGNEGQNNLTRTGTIFGTPFYMAPEQALGNPVDARTDIYAMGVIMYEVFAGTLPFQGESFMGILTQHITTDPEPVAQRAGKAGRMLPPGLADIVTRCMQKNPAQRFSTMDELVAALVAIYRGFAGPGMSTYMEAFPVSNRHPAQTPPPLTGPVVVGAPGTGPYQAPPGSGPVPHLAHAHGQTGQPSHQPSGGHSGLYDPGASVVSVPKKSSLPIIVAVIALLAVGGGIATYVVVNGQTTDGPVAGDGPGTGSAGAGTGSQVAVVVDAAATGSVGGTTNPPIALDAAVATVTPDAEVAAVEPPDAAVSEPPVTPDAAEIAQAPDAGISEPLPPAEVAVQVVGKGGVSVELWEGHKKLPRGPILIVGGKAREITVKARSYRDKKVRIDGSRAEVEVALAKVGGTGPGPGPGSATEPQAADCSKVVVDPKSAACRKQYCKYHADDVRCQMED